MSEFTALRAVSVTLQALLEAEITNSSDPQLNGVPIHLQSPKFLRENNQSGISLWLYRVVREPDTLNRPPERLSATRIRAVPIPLTLHYLVCALREDPRDEQALLGKVVQVFHDHASVSGAELKDDLAGEDEQLRVVLETLTLEEMARVWDSLSETYQLSLSYAVQVVTIDSDRDTVHRPPVLSSTQHPNQILGSAEP